MARNTDPEYDALISRGRVEQLANGDDNVAIWAREMLAATDEEAVFLRGVRVYFERAGRTKRRESLGKLSLLFEAKHADLKRYLRFKGLVNLMD